MTGGAPRRASWPLAAALAAHACTFYAPTFSDCAIRCGEGGACPSETACVDGFCRAPGATRSCECTPGSTRACGSAKGECATGRQSCSPRGQWESACLGEGHPSDEFCDGKDNDCDGVVDDHLIDDVPCPLGVGVCAGHHRPCVDGGHAACTAEDYGQSYEPLEEACDGLDNDCDGLVDVTPSVRWLDTHFNRFAVVGTDAGFSLVFTRDLVSSAQEGLFVQRYDRRLGALGAPVEVRAGLPAKIAARTLGEDVVVGWAGADEVGVARVAPSDAVSVWQPLRDAGFLDSLYLGAQSEVAAVYRAGPAVARLVRWSLDGGLLAVKDLNTLDGGYKTTDVLEVNISTDGHHVAYDGSSNPDAGLPFAFWFFIFDTQTLQTEREYVYFGGPFGKMIVQRGGHLTTTYPYQGFGSDKSGIYFHPDLLNPAVSEIAIASSTTDPNAYGVSDATLDAKGDLGVVYQLRSAGQLGLARSSKVGAQELFATRALPVDAGYGLPAIAASGDQAMLGVVDMDLSGLEARLVCLP